MTVKKQTTAPALRSGMTLPITNDSVESFLSEVGSTWSRKHVNEWRRMFRLLQEAAIRAGADPANIPADLINETIATQKAPTYREAWPAHVRRYQRWIGDRAADELMETLTLTKAAEAPKASLTAQLPSYDPRHADLLDTAAQHYRAYGEAMAELMGSAR